jgi:hypothetical protein
MFGPAWIGVDLDGTLAHHSDDWSDWTVIGEPVPEMVKRVHDWLGRGTEVKILTARVARVINSRAENELAIKRWCLQHIGTVLDVTSEKDPAMIELWDDRAVRVVRNTGVVSSQAQFKFS